MIQTPAPTATSPPGCSTDARRRERPSSLRTDGTSPSWSPPSSWPRTPPPAASGSPGPTGPPGPSPTAPTTAGPVWSPDGRLARLRLPPRREGARVDAPRAARGRARRGADGGDDARRARRPGLVARRPLAGLHQPHAGRPLRGQGRALAAAAQDRAVLRPPRQRGLGVRPPPARLRRGRRRHGAAAQPDAGPVPAHRASAGWPTPRASSRRAPATRAGTATSARTSTWCRSTGPSGR